MVTKRIRSEYMKKFKDPKWETYSKCYEEMLRYRLGRRLLEHSHNAWFWSGSDSDSESGGRSPPASGGEKVQCERGRGRTKAGVEEQEDQQQKKQQQDQPQKKQQQQDQPQKKQQQEQQQQKKQQQQDQQQQKKQQQEQQQPPSCVPRLPLLQEENGSAGHDSHPDGEARATEEKEEQRSGSKTRGQDPETEPGGPRPPQSKPPKHSKQTRRLQRVKPSPSPHPKEDSMDGKHPFALYGSGEKQADIADKKTHNVCPVASTNEIHESALRAKTRREAERQIQTQRSERRRAKSANLDRARKSSQPEFNPWLTEYMRCFSSRSR